MNPQNHPNRNWRRRMQDACTTYLARWNWRAEGMRILSDDEMREQLADAYRAGYTDRHQRDQVARKATHTETMP